MERREEVFMKLVGFHDKSGAVKIENKYKSQ